MKSPLLLFVVSFELFFLVAEVSNQEFVIVLYYFGNIIIILDVGRPLLLVSIFRM